MKTLAISWTMALVALALAPTSTADHICEYELGEVPDPTCGWHDYDPPGSLLPPGAVLQSGIDFEYWDCWIATTLFQQERVCD